MSRGDLGTVQFSIVANLQALQDAQLEINKLRAAAAAPVEVTLAAQGAPSAPGARESTATPGYRGANGANENGNGNGYSYAAAGNGAYAGAVTITAPPRSPGGKNYEVLASAIKGAAANNVALAQGMLADFARQAGKTQYEMASAIYGQNIPEALGVMAPAMAAGETFTPSLVMTKLFQARQAAFQQNSEQLIANQQDVYDEAYGGLPPISEGLRREIVGTTPLDDQEVLSEQVAQLGTPEPVVTPGGSRGGYGSMRRAFMGLWVGHMVANEVSKAGIGEFQVDMERQMGGDNASAQAQKALRMAKAQMGARGIGEGIREFFGHGFQWLGAHHGGSLAKSWGQSLLFDEHTVLQARGALGAAQTGSAIRLATLQSRAMEGGAAMVRAKSAGSPSEELAAQQAAIHDKFLLAENAVNAWKAKLEALPGGAGRVAEIQKAAAKKIAAAGDAAAAQNAAAKLRFHMEEIQLGGRNALSFQTYNDATHGTLTGLTAAGIADQEAALRKEIALQPKNPVLAAQMHALQARGAMNALHAKVTVQNAALQAKVAGDYVGGNPVATELAQLADEEQARIAQVALNPNLSAAQAKSVRGSIRTRYADQKSRVRDVARRHAESSLRHILEQGHLAADHVPGDPLATALLEAQTHEHALVDAIDRNKTLTPAERTAQLAAAKKGYAATRMGAAADLNRALLRQSRRPGYATNIEILKHHLKMTLGDIAGLVKSGTLTAGQGATEDSLARAGYDQQARTAFDSAYHIHSGDAAAFYGEVGTPYQKHGHGPWWMPPQAHHAGGVAQNHLAAIQAAAEKIAAALENGIGALFNTGG